MRKVIKGLGLSLLILSGVFCLFSCNDEIIPPVIEATPSVRGTISLPASSGLFPEDIWVKVVENETTKYVGRVNSDATFSVSGLDAAKKYDVMFTSIEPEQQNVSREFKSRAASTTNGFGGWLSDVSASIDDANIGSVKIKPLGTIDGKAIRSGAVDNYDVMVYIPGTSFMAMTNEDGSFSIANVPQGTHRLRYTSDDYMSQMKEKVLLFSDDDTVNPVTTVSDVILIKNAGILKGYATLNGAASNAGIIIKLEGDNATGSEIGTTASDGSFSIPDVKPGTYSALFSYAGYIDEKVENLVIEAAKTTSLPASVSLIANGGTITGSVTQNDGAAGTGASVLAKVTVGEADFTYSSTVDADGKFTLNDCRPADGYSITVSKTGFASVVRSGISLTVEGIILPEIMLSSEFGGLSGYVEDSKMNAINGAQINIGDYTAFTNSEGYFIKSDLPLGQYTVTVSKDGYTTKTLAQKVSIESNKTATIGEQMLTSMYGSINGTIALNDGKSPEGATVTAASADGRNSYPATAASDGTYSISNVLPATYTLSVIKEGYEAGSKTISVTADYTTAAGTITLESLYGSLKVLVNYADKDPDDKITVSIRNGESSIRTATTSNSSTLIFDDIPVGAGYVVVASALGYSSSEKTSVSVISNTETTVQLDDLSNRYGSVSGTVQASSGSPLSGALVLLKGTSEYTATTDGNGAFAKDGIGIGSYEVTISKDGYGTLTLATAVSVESSKVTSIGTQKLTPTTAVISGSAAYADKTDSTGIAITLVDSAEQPVDSFTTTADGQYTFSNVLPGTYKVKAGATGYSAVEKSITVAAGQGYTVALDSLTSIYGKITGTVKLQGAADYSAIQVTATGVEVYHAQTTAGGAYAIANVLPGTYTLKYEKSSFVTDQSRSAAVVAGASAGVEETTLLSSVGSLKVTASYGDKAIDDKITITLFKGETSITSTTTSVDSGVVTFSNLAIGNDYRAVATANGYSSAEQSGIIVASGAETSVVLVSLSNRYGSVAGKVTDSQGNGMRGALVLLKNAADSAKTYTITTDANGAYAQSAVEVGNYTVTITLQGYGDVVLNQPISVSSGGTTNVGSVKVVSIYGSLGGTVSLNDGKAVEGALISAVSADGKNSYPAAVKADGTYSITNMIPGTYEITMTKEGYASGSKSVVITAETKTEAGLTVLSTTYGSIRVMFGYADKNVDDKITIAIRDGETTVRTALSSNSSSLVFTEIPVGTGYMVSASADGYSSAEQSGISVASNTETTVQLDDLSNRYGSVSGTVQTSSGSPLSGALVLIKGTSEYTATTDENGAFAKDGIGIGSYEVTISKDGYGTLKLATTVIVESSRTTSIGTQKLTPTTAVISGTAGYADKTDCTGIAITLVDSAEQPVDSFTTAAGGQYTFRNVLPGTYKVKSGATGYSAVEKSITVAAGQSYTVALDSLTSIYGKITGTVKLQGTTDYSAIQVTATGTETYHAQTTASGAYTIANVIPGTYTLKYEKSGFVADQGRSADVTAGASTGVEETTLLSSVGSLKVTASYVDKTIDDKITITLFKGETSTTSTTTSVDSGTVTFSNLAIGNDYRAVATASGYSSAEQSGIIVASGAETPVVLASLSNQYGGLSGTVQTSSGSPLSGALVLLQNTVNNSITYTLTTDADGLYSQGSIAIGNYNVTISLQGFADEALSQSISVLSSKATNIGITKLRSLYGSLSGTVKLQGVMDYSGILVTLSGSQTYTASTTSDGSYSISALLPGTYSVTLSKAGFITQTIGDVVITADTNTIVAENTLVSSSCGISGRVVLEGSTGNAGAIVSASYVGDSSKVYSTTTLEDGTYSFTGLDAGQYSIKMQMTGYVSDNSRLITTAYGEVTTVANVTLKSVTSTVKGNVTLSGSIDHTGINVLLKAADASRQYDVTTDQGGAYTITKVQPGVYDLYASKSGFETKTVTDITIEPTSTKTIDSLNLAVAIRSITGSVELELRTDHSGALITATKVTDPTKVYSAISNSAGNYTLAGMEPGEYGIVITSAGYRTMTLPTTDVAADSTASLSKTSLMIARGTIAGIVTLEGRSSQEGTNVELLGTEYQTLTNALGEYSFNVPQGNYPGGLRFTKEDFKADSRTDTIPVLTDSVYAVPNTELIATHVSIYGTVDVQGTDDDSAVTVLFDNSTHSETVVTDATGAFRFDHVVLGSHTLRFKRDYTPDVTVQLTATPSDGMNVNTVVLTPNSASIHGIVKLKDVTSYAGVKVEVQVQDKGTLSTKTGAGGDYYIGEIYSVGTHTVTYSKGGWVGQSTTVTGLSPLEDRGMAEVTLVDTTAPVLNSITINSGANTAADNTVTLHIDATELGSGISKMQLCYDNVFDQTVTMRNYSSSFDWALPSGNGLKTVYMKVYDASGNASNVVSASVTLTDQKKEVKGVLTGEDLHWTEAMSPYLVTGNLLVQDTDTLTIDAGVDVQFAGDYYMQVEGVLNAIGTENKKISFYGVDGQTWNGINCTKNNGSRISYASIVDLVKGLQNYANIDNSLIESDTGFVLGMATTSSNSFQGVAEKNKISGRVTIGEATLYENNITVRGTESYLHNRDQIYSSFLSGNLIGGTYIYVTNSLCENTQFTNMAVSSYMTGMKNCTLQNCSVDMTDGGLYTQSVFTDCTFNNFTPAILHKSNLTNCSNITISSARSSIEEIDLRDNFWGYDKTREMDENGLDYNLSFINDWYDDFNKAKAIVTGYKADPYENIGYLGELYYPSNTGSVIEYEIGDIGLAGGLVFYDKGYYSYGWRYLEAAPSDLGAYVFGYYRATDNSDPLVTGTGLGIGSGRINTEMLFESMGGEACSNHIKDGVRTADYAAKKCLDYEVGGYDDWFLPSKDELNLMRQNLYLNNLGGFSDDYYWSSSEDIVGNAWEENFDGGRQYTHYRSYNFRVRPVRAF